MLSIFKHVPDKQPPRIYPEMNNFKHVIMSNYEECSSYWRDMNWSVRGDHILVAILNAAVDIISDNPLDIYRYTQDTIEQHTSARGFVSSITYGRVQPKSYFYGKDCQEIYVNQSFDDAIEQMVTKPWQYWESIRIVEHPFTSLDLQLANGKLRHSGESGLCILKMDIALMYTQYRMWLNSSRSKYADGTHKAITNFIHSYPIVNLLKTHLERAWFNRFFAIALGQPISNQKDDTRLMLRNPYIDSDKVLKRMDETVRRSRANFHEWICWMPGIYCKHLKEHLLQDLVMETHQNKLAFAFGRLKAMEWLFRMEYEIRTGADGQWESEYLKKYREYKYGRTFGTIRGLHYDDVIYLYESKLNSYLVI